MENNKNELTLANLVGAQVVKNDEGKFKRVAQYEHTTTINPETREEMVQLFNIVNGDDESVISLKDAVNNVIELSNIVTTPYEKVDELTGEVSFGVSTILFSSDGNKYATSSKSVYWTLNNAFKLFGKPGDDGYTPLKLKVVRKKGYQFEYIDVQLIG